jgi:hypothetical protein
MTLHEEILPLTGGKCNSGAYIPSFFMIFCISGGTKNENGSETIKPIPQPDSHAEVKWALKPTLIAAIAKDMHSDMIAAIQTPKKSI